MKNWYIYAGLIAAILIVLVALRGNGGPGTEAQTTKYDDFAQCLTDAGAIFYGAYWCPHCRDQKEMFENSKNLPYVECSTPNGQGQTRQCIEEGITGYPLWKFADGTQIEGVVQLNELAEKTGCALPE